MEALATIGKAALEQVQPSSEATTTLAVSCKPLPAQQVAALGRWMVETQASFPNQEFPDGTADMWLAQWQEMAATNGLEVFRLGLLRAIRDSRFFPTPDAIREACVAEATDRHYQKGAKNYLEDLAEMRAVWEKDRGKETYLTPDQQAAKERIEARLAAVRAAKKPEGDAA